LRRLFLPERTIFLKLILGELCAATSRTDARESISKKAGQGEEIKEARISGMLPEGILELIYLVQLLMGRRKHSAVQRLNASNSGLKKVRRMHRRGELKGRRNPLAGFESSAITSVQAEGSVRERFPNVVILPGEAKKLFAPLCKVPNAPAKVETPVTSGRPAREAVYAFFPHSFTQF
jgi:hypothetical protein